MANCSQCGRDVGCGCNLISGSCAGCYNKTLDNNDQSTVTRKKTSKRVVYVNQPDAPPNTEFNEILKAQGLSRQEKLKRINDILEKARQTI
jgi:hypothetical protein